MKLYITFFIQW